MSDTAQAKRALRRQMRARRRALTATARRRQQRQLQARLAALLRRRGLRRVGLYRAVASELDLGALASALPRRTQALYPRMRRHGLVFVPAHPRWQATAVRTLEPAGRVQWPVWSLDVLLLPLLACDARGMRLGQGGGWYDRTLAGSRWRRPLCVGVGFDEQYTTTVPAAAHDAPLDVYLSARIARAFTPRGQRWLTGF